MPVVHDTRIPQNQSRDGRAHSQPLKATVRAARPAVRPSVRPVVRLPVGRPHYARRITKLGAAIAGTILISSYLYLLFNMTFSSTQQSVTGNPAPVKVYIVQKGDTAGRIASRFGVTLSALKIVNPDVLRNPDRIFPGQSLIIPAKK